MWIWFSVRLTDMTTLNPTHPAALPRHVAWLGYGGLLPFIVLVALAGSDPHHRLAWSDALAGYGAVILSFIGALHWGVAMSAPGLDPVRRRRAFVWSVVPALLAWPATLLAGSLAPLILVPGFVLHIVQDKSLVGPAGLPAWYWPLRWRLTVVAVICLLANAWQTWA